MRSFVLLMLSCVLVACHSGSFDERVADAEARLGTGDTHAALARYRSLSDDIRNDPRRAGILLRIADLQAAMESDPEAAIRAYGEVIDERPLSPASQIARERRAALSVSRGNYEGAIEDYAALLKHFGTGADAWRYRILMAGTYLTDRNYRQARVEIKSMVEGNGTPPEFREQAAFLAAESFFLEGNIERAAQYYQWFLRDFPKSPLAAEAKLHLATCLEEMGYLGLARDMTRSAGGQYPNQKVVEARLKSIDERGTTPAAKPAAKPAARPKAPAKAPK